MSSHIDYSEKGFENQIKSVMFFVFAGILIGVANGFASRLLIKKYIDDSNSAFFCAFAAGMAYRFIFLLLAVFIIKKHGLYAILSFSIPLLLFQEGFLLFPIKSKH